LNWNLQSVFLLNQSVWDKLVIRSRTEWRGTAG
jgi:hypothetical protein